MLRGVPRSFGYGYGRQRPIFGDGRVLPGRQPRRVISPSRSAGEDAQSRKLMTSGSSWALSWRRKPARPSVSSAVVRSKAGTPGVAGESSLAEFYRGQGFLRIRDAPTTEVN